MRGKFWKEAGGEQTKNRFQLIPILENPNQKQKQMREMKCAGLVICQAKLEKNLKALAHNPTYLAFNLCKLNPKKAITRESE